MKANITLFITVMLLTIAFLRQATAADVEPKQDPENTCYLSDTCKPTRSIDNPFGE